MAEILMVKPEREALVARVQALIEDGAGFAVLPTWPSDQEASPPAWRAEVRTLAAALGVALWNTLCTSPGVAICANCLGLFEIHQGDQRYCRENQCQTERKRVEKAQLRAKKAAATAHEPEYAI